MEKLVHFSPDWFLELPWFSYLYCSDFTAKAWSYMTDTSPLLLYCLLVSGIPPARVDPGCSGRHGTHIWYSERFRLPMWDKTGTSIWLVIFCLAERNTSPQCCWDQAHLCCACMSCSMCYDGDQWADGKWNVYFCIFTCRKTYLWNKERL